MIRSIMPRITCNIPLNSSIAGETRGLPAIYRGIVILAIMASGLIKEASAYTYWEIPNILSRTVEYFPTYDEANAACLQFQADVLGYPDWPCQERAGFLMPLFTCKEPHYDQPNTQYYCNYPIQYGEFFLFTCPTGFSMDRELGCQAPPKDLGPPPPGACAGNPINIGTGNKYQAETDYIGTGPFSIRITRHYNSQAGTNGRLGYNWSLFPALAMVSSTSISASRPDGRVIVFTLQSGQWIPDADVNERLTSVSGGASWELAQGDGVIEIYNSSGVITAYRYRSGLALTITYPSASQTVITDSFGRSLVLDLDAQGRVDRITDPSGGLYRYTYDTSGNLAMVIYSDDTPGDDTDNPRRSYLYEDSRFPHALTGITDESGQHYATYGYDNNGRAFSSEHAGGAGG